VPRWRARTSTSSAAWTAKSASLDGIGALMFKDPLQKTSSRCLHSDLIAPRVVLTAKHCAMENDLQQAGGPQQYVEMGFIDVYPTFRRSMPPPCRFR
jgi:hypothetical protein